MGKLTNFTISKKKGIRTRFIIKRYRISEFSISIKSNEIIFKRN